MSMTNTPASRSDDDQGDRGREPPREDDASSLFVRKLKFCTSCNKLHIVPGPCKKRSHSKVSTEPLPQSLLKTIKKTPTVLSPYDQSNMDTSHLMGEFDQLRNDVRNLQSRVDATFSNVASHHNEATVDSTSIDVDQVHRLLSDASVLIYCARRAAFPRPAADEATNNNVQGQIMRAPQLRSPSKTLSMQSQQGRLLIHPSRSRYSSRVPCPESNSSGPQDSVGLFRGTSESIPPEASAGNVPDRRVRDVSPMVIGSGYDYSDEDFEDSEDEPLDVGKELDKEEEAEAKRLRTSKKSS